jgi:hypothetical protein
MVNENGYAMARPVMLNDHAFKTRPWRGGQIEADRRHPSPVATAQAKVRCRAPTGDLVIVSECYGHLWGSEIRFGVRCGSQAEM